MDDTISLVPDNIRQPLLVVSSSSTFSEAINRLIETGKTSDGRSHLASKGIAIPVLEVCRFLSLTSRQDLLLSSLKLLRNLCAGEIRNQNLFIEDEAVRVLLEICRSVGSDSGSDNGILRMLLQVLGNVSLAGERHQLAVWRRFFPDRYLEIARIRNKEICDPLCMVIYTCSRGSDGLHSELLAESGQATLIEIIRTATIAGFKEDWLKLLLSGICFEERLFSSVFSKLSRVVDAEIQEDILQSFGDEQAFLLNITSKILNERLGDIIVPSDFASYVLGILQHSVQIVDFTIRGKSNLPTGCADVDVLGYSLTILRDICACNDPVVSRQDEKEDVTDMLVSDGLIELLITLLRNLEPPTIIRKATTQSNANDGTNSHSSKYCPYNGFRRDILAVIGNCCYRRKHVQDKIREQEGIVLLLQQCVIDEENPFLREWGMWTMHNILEGNAENLKFVADLELQGTVDVPELTQMGLRVEVDPKTQRAKLICNAVAVAGYLNATLIDPNFPFHSIWRDPSKFGDIYDEEYFMRTLANDVRIVKKAPGHIMERFGYNFSNVYNFKIKAWSSIEYNKSTVLPKLLEEKIIRISPFANRLSFNAPPAVQRLRCLANYQALRFSNPLLTLGETLVARMKAPSANNSGKYISVHLRFEDVNWHVKEFCSIANICRNQAITMLIYRIWLLSLVVYTMVEMKKK